MKWFFWILVILTAVAVVAGLVVIVSFSDTARPIDVSHLPRLAPAQLATFTPRPTRAAPTSAPTEAPVAVATATLIPPTATPAAQHTATVAPTKAPTKAATTAPTKAPTQAAKAAPTKAATTAPTKAATVAPKAPTEAATATPSRTATAYPIRAGWTDHAAADFRLALPERWEAVDATKEGIQAILDAVGKMDSDWARNMAEMYSAESLQKSIKFWAMDSQAVRGSYATVAVTTLELSEETPLRQLMPKISTALKDTGAQVTAITYGLRVNGLDAARMSVRFPVGSLTAQEYTYVYMRGKKVWVGSYAVDQRYWDTYAATFASSARSFRAD
jgi:hypothetical protein